MSFNKVGHAVEPKIVLWRFARMHRRPKTLLIEPAINPARREAVTVRGSVIMEHALRDVKDLAPLDPQRPQLCNHVLEILI